MSDTRPDTPPVAARSPDGLANPDDAAPPSERVPTAADELWSRVLETIRGYRHFRELLHWVTHVRADRQEDGCLFLVVPNDFIRDHILRDYRDDLLDFARRADPALESIDLAVRRDSRRVPAAATDSDDPDASAPPFFRAPVLRPRMCFERFVGGRCNEAAIRNSVHFAEAPRPSFRSLFIHGGIGTGKTHIRHAITRRFQELNPDLRILSVSANEYANEYGRACRESLAQAFWDYCSGVDLLAIDDLPSLANRPKTQLQLLPLIDLLLETGRRVVAFGDKPLAAMNGIHGRITGRLTAGPACEINPPDADTRFAILKNIAESLGSEAAGIVWERDALRYIAERASSDGRDLEGCILQLLSEVEPLGLPVTRERAERILQNRFLSLRPRLGIPEVRKIVAKHFGVEERTLCSKSRTSQVVLARQVAMYVARSSTGLSLSTIGSEFGRRDHSTVSYAIGRIRERCERELAFDAEVRELIRTVEAA